MRGADDILACVNGLAHDVFLHQDYLLDGHLHAQIATCNHDSIGVLDDFVDVLDALAILDLADEVDV